MSLLCLASYLSIGLFFTLLFWMTLAVGKKHDNETSFLHVNETGAHGD
jgi:hypothetical protein